MVYRMDKIKSILKETVCDGIVIKAWTSGEPQRRRLCWDWAPLWRCCYCSLLSSACPGQMVLEPDLPGLWNRSRLRNGRLRLTRHLSRERSDCVVEASGLPWHHCVNVPFAHEDGKDPDTLAETSFRSLQCSRFSKGSHLAHVERVSEDEHIWVDVLVRQGECQDLEVPDDPHAKEEANEDHHLVHHLRPAASSFRRCAASTKVTFLPNKLT